ncbi:MAG: PqiC family protein [Aeromonas sp.]
MKKSFIALAAGLLLTGCASPAPTLHHYALDAKAPLAASAASTPSRSLTLRPIVLSSQLDRISLVYQLEGQELHFAEFHRWAGALDDQLNQLTQNGLSRRLPGWAVQGSNQAQAPQLSIHVERFQGRHDGRALLSGRWQLTNAQGQLLKTATFASERALPDDGYNVLVAELGQGWQVLLDEIAQEIKALPAAASR